MVEDSLASAEAHKIKLYETAYEILLNGDASSFAELDERIKKIDFFRWLATEKGLLLHGSNSSEIVVLEPREAKCKAKEFGNQKAVFATDDAVLPTFYAIINRNLLGGEVQSGLTKIQDGGRTIVEYHFAVDRQMLNQSAWSSGAVYVLPKDSFMQGHNAEGEPIDEWASLVPVKPIAKIAFTPEEFTFMDQVQAI